jgi:membrane protease YdiL (CAAX protease family)
MLVPASCALAVRYARVRRFSALWRPLRLPSVGTALLSAALPVGILLTVAALDLLLGFAKMRPEDAAAALALPSAGTLFLGLLLVFGEEYGWRGFLLDELTERVGVSKALALTGAVWALWHAPILYGLAKRLGLSAPETLVLIQMAAVFLVAYPMGWLYLRERSLWPPIVFHFVWNWFNPLWLGDIYTGRPGLVVGDMLLINGETLMGLVVMAPLAYLSGRALTSRSS